MIKNLNSMEDFKLNKNIEELLNVDLKLKGDLDIPFLIDKVQLILNSTFSDIRKQKIKQYSNRLNFACPYCGDSSYNNNKARGNIFFENNTYKCFNGECGVHKSIFEFFKDFENISHLTPEEKIKCLNIQNHNKNKFISNKELFDKSDYKKFIEKVPIEDFIKNKKLTSYKDVKKFKSYIDSRLIPNNKRDNLFVDDKNLLVISNLIKCEENEYVISYSRRTNFKDNKYLIYSYDKLVKPDDFENNMEFKNFNEISNIFNLFNIDLNKDIIVCEGYFDSCFLPNCISTSGANKKIPIISDFLYLFDNDLTGIKQSISHIKNKETVFLWKKLLSDFNIKENLKDINDLIIYLYKKSIDYRDVNFYDYFSNERLDAIWI